MNAKKEFYQFILKKVAHKYPKTVENNQRLLYRLDYYSIESRDYIRVLWADDFSEYDSTRPYTINLHIHIIAAIGDFRQNNLPLIEITGYNIFIEFITFHKDRI